MFLVRPICQQSTRKILSRSCPLTNNIQSLTFSKSSFSTWTKTMATVKDSIPHVVRTAADQRQRTLYNASIGAIQLVNSRIRVIKLYLDPDAPPLRHLPGQYIDLHVPSISTVGGFTITSAPQTALRLPAPTPSTSSPASAATFDDPFIELAIQASPGNPPAAYLWRPPEQIMNAPVQFRVGGNFTYPPFELSREEFSKVDSVVFVAGGVGINPIMSMLSAIDSVGSGRIGGVPKRVRVLYSSRRTRDGKGLAEEVLFEERLRGFAGRWAGREEVDLRFSFYETGEGAGKSNEGENVKHVIGRRMGHDDLFEALGSEDGRANTLVYICGVPSMTDEFVELLGKAPGMDEKRVYCEKWW